jgi:hypothetical protein
VVLLGELETLKCQAEGAQAMAAVALDASVRAEQAAAGVPADRRGQGVGLQVALARRESHHRGARHLGLARTLAGELPHTLAALRDGRITEWRATLVARETGCLTRDDRRHVDQVLDEQTLAGAGERELVAEVKRLAYRLDPQSSWPGGAKRVAAVRLAAPGTRHDDLPDRAAARRRRRRRLRRVDQRRQHRRLRW